MSLDRNSLYRLPWSKTDNPGGWVEVTDECNFQCKGCYRKNLEGHRPLEEIKKDIIACRRMTNCDGIAISGGEPLLYPHIVEVVGFISKLKIKSYLLTNGEKLTWQLASDLKKAGLDKIHFHIDSGQDRPSWTGKNEVELNKLRQHYADMIWELGKVQCGFHVTVYRSSLHNIPDIIEWCRANIHKVQHLSIIALRGTPITDDLEYRVKGKKIDPETIPNSTKNLSDINITTEEMFELVSNRFPSLHPGVYSSGTSAPETTKYLLFVNIGNQAKVFGCLGARTLEIVQVFYHLFKHRYCIFTKNPKTGRKVFALSVFDKEVRKAFRNYLKTLLKNPITLFRKIYAQSIMLQQPIEIIDGMSNHCDGCVNQMVYGGKLIYACRLDEYRQFGTLITSLKK